MIISKKLLEILSNLLKIILILKINMIRNYYHDQGSLILKIIVISDHICTRNYY
jgi:hypothetical protein